MDPSDTHQNAVNNDLTISDAGAAGKHLFLAFYPDTARSGWNMSTVDDVTLSVETAAASVGQFVRFDQNAATQTVHGTVIFDPTPTIGGVIDPGVIVTLGTPAASGAIEVDGLMNLPTFVLLDVLIDGDDTPTLTELQALAAELNDTATLGDDDDGDGDTFAITAIDPTTNFGTQGFDLKLLVNDWANLSGNDFIFEWIFDDTTDPVTVGRVAIVPAPAALPAGLVLLGLVGLKRRRA